MKILAYIIGSILVIAGILLGAMQLGVPQSWLLIIGLVTSGIAITSIASHVVHTRRTVANNGGSTTKSETVVN